MQTHTKQVSGTQGDYNAAQLIKLTTSSSMHCKHAFTTINRDPAVVHSESVHSSLPQGNTLSIMRIMQNAQNLEALSVSLFLCCAVCMMPESIKGGEQTHSAISLLLFVQVARSAAFGNQPAILRELVFQKTKQK